MQKTFDSAKIYKICLKFAISILLVLIVAFVPTIIIIMNSPIQEDHFVKKSEYQGVVELWNIDCFEGGTGSKASFLSARQAKRKQMFGEIKRVEPNVKRKITFI